jgi:hypothetical protein
MGGPVRFGYRVEGKQYVEDPAEQQTVREIVRLRDGPPRRTWKQVGSAVGLHPNTVKKVYRRETGRSGGRVHAREVAA